MIRGMEGREEEEGGGRKRRGGEWGIGGIFRRKPLFFNDIFAYINKFMYLCRLKWFVLRNTLQDNI